MKALEIIFLIIGAIVFVAAAYALSAFVTMALWNFLAGYFGFKKVTFFVALIFTIVFSLIRSIFKNK